MPGRGPPKGPAAERPAARRRRPGLLGTALLASLLLSSGCGSLFPEGIFGGRTGGAAGQTEEQRMMTAQAQRILTKLGYQPGAADGLAGPRTREAIREFQIDNGLPQDGQVSQTLLKRLAGAVGPGEGTQTGGHIKAASPPKYEPGTTFIYSDGLIMRVVGVEGDKVRWRTNRGDTLTADRNFVVPWLSWYSDGRSGERRVRGRPETLWPLKTGRRAAFTIRTTTRDRARAETVRKITETWACSVAGAERVAVVAGHFSTLKVVCDRTLDDGSPKLKRVWYYAHDIGHFVRRNDLYDAVESDRHVELVAIQPGGPGWPPAARAGLGWALEDALESLKDGSATQWRSSGVDVRVGIRLGKSFERGDGKQCRTFVQTWLTAGHRKSYPGTACRDASGAWQIPGLENTGDGSLAVSGSVS